MRCKLTERKISGGCTSVSNDDMFQEAQIAADRFNLIQQQRIHDQNPCSAVIQVKLKVFRAIQSIQADRNRSDFNGPEKRLGIDLRIKEEQRYPFLHSDID